MGSQWTFSRASITGMSFMMLGFVILFSDPNSVCIWELMKCLVFTKIIGDFVSATRQGWRDMDFHAQGASQARSMADHMGVSTQSELSPKGIWACLPPQGREENRKWGRVGSVWNRSASQCPRCDEQLDPLTVPNTWCIKELTEIQFLQRKASAL